MCGRGCGRLGVIHNVGAEEEVELNVQVEVRREGGREERREGGSGAFEGRDFFCQY